MASSSNSASSVPSASPTSVSPSPPPFLPLDNQRKSTRAHFQAREDVLMLHEVVAVESAFIHRSSCWEDIASTLQRDCLAKFAKVTAQTVREDATNLMEAFLSADTRQHKQNGTEDKFKE